jgi:hypothetical protein
MSVVFIVSFPVLVDFQMVQGQYQGTLPLERECTHTSQTAVNLDFHDFAFNNLRFLFNAHPNTTSKCLRQSFCLGQGQREDLRGSDYCKRHIGTKGLRHSSGDKLSIGGNKKNKD